MVLCPCHSCHREICTRNRPISETIFFWRVPNGVFQTVHVLQIPDLGLRWGNLLRSHSESESEKKNLQILICSRFRADGKSIDAPCAKGSKRCFPNGVFQISHLGLRQRNATSEGKRMPENTSVFKHFGGFCPCRSWRPIDTPLWKTPFRKHRLENSLVFGWILGAPFLSWPCDPGGLLQNRETGKSRKWLGRVLGRMLRKFGVLAGVLARVLLLIPFQGKPPSQHPRQHSRQHPEFWQHSSQHPPQPFSGFLKFRRVTIRGAQPSVRLSEEICLSEGSAGVSRRVLQGSAGFCGVRGIFRGFSGAVTLSLWPSRTVGWISPFLYSVAGRPGRNPGPFFYCINTSLQSQSGCNQELYASKSLC